jgi:hypothetical protein
MSRARAVQKKSSRTPARVVIRVPRRSKLSTTVASENFTFLEGLVRTGRTSSMAEAVDLAIERLRVTENRGRLERATAAYFDGLSPENRAEEEMLARHLHASGGGIDFDAEP